MNQNDKTRIANVKVMLQHRINHLNDIAAPLKGDNRQKVAYHHIKQAVRRMLEAEENLKVVLDELYKK